jgi:Tol biopolymer transport system component
MLATSTSARSTGIHPGDGCLAEDELLDLASGRRALAEAPTVEAHLASCPSCSELLSTLIHEDEVERAASWGDLVGRSLGHYRLEAQIGAGASGAVYRAWDERLGRRVAVKVLSARLAGSPEQIRRLEAEGRAAAAITHPNVTTIHDAGSVNGMPFLVSELHEGESLRSLITRGALPRERAVTLGIELARGLAAAHAEGVIHRDLKPENLLVTREGTLKILDFGLAKLTAPRPDPDLDATLPGTLLGTLGYLSPEQARGEPADARSDLFAAGAVLYEMLCGERAFAGATFAERLSATLRDTPPGLVDSRLGDALPAVARCLEKEPQRRFQSALDLAWTLEGLRDPGAALPVKSRPAAALGISRRTLLVATASALGGAALGGALGALRRPAATAPIYQQLTYRHGRVAAARLTHDGATVIYAAEWDGKPLTVFATRLDGGGTRALAVPSASVLAVSSRGDLALGLGQRYVEGFHQTGTLAVVPLEGGEPRILAERVQEADFTPDGREVLAVRRGGRGFRLELVSGAILFESDGWLSHARLAPDGQRVACLAHPATDDDRGAVVIVERSTGAARPLSDGWSSLAGLAWSPDGRAVAFSGAREGSNNAVHSVTLGGRESLIAASTGRLRLHDFAADGRAMITHDTWRMRMMVSAPGAISEADLSLSEISAVTELSADGRTILFGEYGESELANGVYLRGTDGGPALHLGPGQPLALSADGRRVAALLFGSPSRVVVYSTTAGDRMAVALGPITTVLSARFRGAAHLVVVGAESGRPPRVWSVDLGAGTTTPITDEGLHGHAKLSPDGARAAFITDDGRCVVVPGDVRGPVVVVPGAYLGERVLGYHANGRELFVSALVSPIRVRRVDAISGAAAVHLEITPPPLGRKGIDAVAVSASGDAHAYSYGQELSRLYAMSRAEPG